MTWLRSSIYVRKGELILEYHVCEQLKLCSVDSFYILDKFALIYIIRLLTCTPNW